MFQQTFWVEYTPGLVGRKTSGQGSRGGVRFFGVGMGVRVRGEDMKVGKNEDLV